MSGLDDMTAALRGLADFEAEAAKDVRDALDEAVKRSAEAGASPDGAAWAPTKAGGRAMARAAEHIETRVHGNVVRQTLTGPDVFHHFGARGEPRRQVIPDGGGPLPKVVDDALEKGAAKAFARLTGGRT